MMFCTAIVLVMMILTGQSVRVEGANPVSPGSRLDRFNRRPFSRPEAAFYELVSAPAVRTILSPVILHEVRGAPAGTVLDVGCGGGAIVADVRASGRQVVAVDPSIPQLRRVRRRRADLGGTAALAGALPFRSGSFAAVMSSCAIKHWPDISEGLAECARVLAPGCRLVIVEIDGGLDGDDLLRFASRARIPPGLRRLYRSFARRTFVPVSPPAASIMSACRRAGFGAVADARVDGLPFLVVTARR